MVSSARLPFYSLSIFNECSLELLEALSAAKVLSMETVLLPSGCVCSMQGKSGAVRGSLTAEGGS